MTLEECVKEGYDVTLYLDEKCLWHWDINNGAFGSVGGSVGYYNPNSAKLELLEFLKDWKGFDE